MRFSKRFKACLLGLLVVLPTIFLAGCSGDTYNSTSTTSTDSTASVKVQGLLRDAVSNVPLAKAVIDVGTQTATSNENGQFTLAINPTGASSSNFTGTYTATINLSGTNALLKEEYDKRKAADPNTPEPYYYPTVEYRKINVQFKSTFSNSSTVVNELTPTQEFTIGKLSTTINGVAYYAKGLQRLPADSTVNLYTRFSSGTENIRLFVGTVKTGANGLFTFNKIQANAAVELEVRTADGSYSGTRTGISTPGMDGGILKIDQVSDASPLPASAGIPATAIDTQAPIIMSVNTETGSDIDPTVPKSVVFTFSKPIAPTAYANALTPSSAGIYNDVKVNYNGAKAGNVAHELQWNATRTALTVRIPVLGASSRYSIVLGTETPKKLVTLADADGNPLSDPKNLFKIEFTTFGGKDATPPVVIVANKASLDYNDFPVLDWLPTSGAKYYAVYRSLVQNWGTTTVDHPSQLLGTTYDTFFKDSLAPDIASGANYPASQNKMFVENGSVKLTYKYVVKAVNSDNVEGAASVVTSESTAADTNGPQLLSSKAATMLLDLMDGNNTIRLYFNEPLDEASAESSPETSYTFSNISGAPTVVSAVYNGWTPPVAPATTGWSTVDLTLSDVIDPAAVGQAFIGTGANGINNTAVSGSDTTVIASGSGAPNSVCVTFGVNNVPDTFIIGGDDFIGTTAITSGPNGICETTANNSAPADDEQALPLNNGQANQRAISSGIDLILNSFPITGSDDTVSTFPFLKVSNVKDVAGNVIQTSADELASGFTAAGTAAQRTIR